MYLVLTPSARAIDRHYPLEKKNIVSYLSEFFIKQVIIINVYVTSTDVFTYIYYSIMIYSLYFLVLDFSFASFPIYNPV